MSHGIQSCVRCTDIEEGETGPGGKYLCIGCYRAGHRLDSLGRVQEHAEEPWPPILGRLPHTAKPYTADDNYGEGRT